MPNLIDASVEATAWMEKSLALRAGSAVFGRVSSAVIWSDAKDGAGNLLVSIDPIALVAQINAAPFPLLLGHDPGHPLGKMLAAEVFKSSAGETFVAAVLGFYQGAAKLGFGDLGLDAVADAPSPADLPPLPADLRFELAADPRDIDLASLDELARVAPIPIDVRPRSNNAAEAAHTLVVVSVAYLALVWNPFVTTIAKEAGKDIYAAIRSWLKKLSARLAERKNPVIEIQSYNHGCHISFMIRGQDVAQHYRAHDSLHGAAARAANLAAKMKTVGVMPVRLIYEFHPSDEIWYPSYAELSDGRLVTDNAALIAVENLPSGLSLGLSLKSLEEPGSLSN